MARTLVESTQLVACLLAMAFTVCNSIEIPHPTLEMPFLERTYGMRDNGRIFESLNSLKFNSDSSPQAVLKQLQQLRGRSSDRWDKENLDNLIGLAVDNEKECGFGQYEMFIKVYLIMKRTKRIQNPQVFIDYLEHFGKLRYPKCAQKVLEDFANKLKDGGEEVAEIEENLKFGLRLNDNASDEKLLSELRRQKLMREKKPVDYSDMVLENLEELPLVHFCDDLTRSFGNDFNVLNLASLLEPEVDYFNDNVHLEIMNEANMICIDWQNGLSKEAST